ncbi:MAG: bifunctional 2-polyprenyl-6-hydroxyphenol methylase/3-demethylubiquinol 3-O-methyltransferase UbiG [Steroidobacteraceae bacterium]
MSFAANVDGAEVGKFDAQAHAFWDPAGPFRTLHAMNPLRFGYVRERAVLAGARVADVGCGGGLMAEALARAGATVTAIDLAPGMVEVARLHAADQAVAIDYRVEAVESLAARAPQGFDVVTCMEMIEHVPDPAALLRALAALLRPGGALFLSTLNRTPAAFLLAIVGAEYLARLVPRGTHEYARLVRPAEMAAWGRAAGLDLLDVSGVQFNPLSFECRLGGPPRINYLAQFVRPGNGG